MRATIGQHALVATAVAINKASCQLWNDSSAPILVHRLFFQTESAGPYRATLYRTSARGTASGNIALAAGHFHNPYASSVPSISLDLGTFSVEPTQEAAGVRLAVVRFTEAGMMYERELCEPIIVLPSRGLAWISSGTDGIGVADVEFEFEIL